MSTTPFRGGSSVHAHSVTPSLNLAKLAELLAKALPPIAASAQKALPLVTCDGSKLVINTRGVLMRLYGDAEFIQQFAPGADSGFVRDLLVPPRGTTARVGGRLLHGTETAATKGIEKLHSAASAALDEALAGVDLSRLTVDSLDSALQLMANTVNERRPSVLTGAALVPVVFASNDRHANERAKDIGKVLTAIETVEAQDRLIKL